MPSFGAGSYLLMGEALGEALYKAKDLTEYQQVIIVAAFARRLHDDNANFRVDQFGRQVMGYIELARQTDEITTDFEEDDEPGA